MNRKMRRAAKHEDMCAVPVKFWQAMPEDEFSRFVLEQDGWLNEEQCARLWRMEERNSEPPKRMQVLLKRSEIEAQFKEQ